MQKGRRRRPNCLQLGDTSVLSVNYIISLTWNAYAL
jgi:hypothetical protein